MEKMLKDQILQEIIQQNKITIEGLVKLSEAIKDKKDKDLKQEYEEVIQVYKILTAGLVTRLQSGRV